MDARARKKMQEVYLPDLVGDGYGEMWRTKCRWVAIKGSRRSKKSKTQALKMIYLLLKYPESNGLVVRRFYNTLAASCFTELKWAANRFGIRECFKFKESPLEVTYLPTGQKILFRGLDDSLKITSISVEVGALCWVWFEEAYEIEEEEDFNKVCDSIMGALPDGYYKQITLTFNPWSPSTWIKNRFFDVDDPDIFARTTNYMCNEWLSDSDRAEFERMKEKQPNRYRVSGLGEWGVDGAVYFEEFREDVHVVTPFVIPDHWKIYRVIDYGLDMLAGLYIAEDPRGNAYVIGEVYKPGLIVSKAAEALRKAEPRAQKYITYAPPDLWSRTKDSGRSIDELFHENGVTLTRSSNDRFAGWSQVLERIKVFDGEDGQPTARLKIFSTCRNLIRCLSVIKVDEDDCNDVATEPHELTHAPDALRYWCVAHTLAPKEIEEITPETAEQKMLADHKEAVFRKKAGRRKVVR